MDWQSWGLLLSAYSSATLLPGSSELALGALLHQAPDRWLWWLLVRLAHWAPPAPAWWEPAALPRRR